MIVCYNTYLHCTSHLIVKQIEFEFVIPKPDFISMVLALSFYVSILVLLHPPTC